MNFISRYVERFVNVIKSVIDDAKRIWALQNLKRHYSGIRDDNFKEVFIATQNAGNDVTESAKQLLAYYLDNYDAGRMAQLGSRTEPHNCDHL